MTAIVSEDGAKHYKIKLDETNLFVRKVTVSEEVLGANKKTLLKTPVNYRYNEVTSKVFLATAGQRSWKQEDIFPKDCSRLIVAMCCSDAFIATKTLNQFSYRKFGLNETIIYHDGFATAGTPMSATDKKQLYYSSMAALAYVENDQGISLSLFLTTALWCSISPALKNQHMILSIRSQKTVHYPSNSSSVQRCRATLKLCFSGRSAQRFITILRETFPNNSLPII